MSGHAILAGILGLGAIFALMVWNGLFMHGDPVEPQIKSESNR